MLAHNSFEPEVYVLFSRSTKKLAVGSWAIIEAEKREYSHTAILYKCPISDEYMIFQASLGMVNCFNYEIFKQKNQIIKMYKLPTTYDKFIEFYTFKQKKLGKSYSTSQLLWIGLSKLFQIKHLPARIYNCIMNGDSEFICSEIAAISASMLDIDLSKSLINKQLDLITPSDLDSILESKGLIWQKCDL